jgi:adenosylmethionine-8-amino-7-oxononanoate aminotransferase
MQTSALAALDRSHLIHPVASFREHEELGPIILKSGQGAYLTDHQDKQLLDAFSGLWCVNTGYGQESVIRAATEQMQRLPYATGYFHFASEPAILLAKKLVDISPASLKHVYFTLGGSDAVDAAIRYITHYHNSIGKPAKKHFISLQRGYHGSSSVGAGLTALPNFHYHFNLPLPTQHYLPSPYPYRSELQGDEAIIAARCNRCATGRRTGRGQCRRLLLRTDPGFRGVVVPPKGWLKAMQLACNQLDILFVVDEVITGFGRTGPMFACLDEDVQPDLMTMAKGLTAGYAPMGAVMMSDRVYNGIADGAPMSTVVGHGQTYSAHPVSAAVALEVLRLYEEGGLLENGRRLEPVFAGGLRALLDHPLVGDARSRGLLGALELVADKQTKARFAPELKLHDRIFRWPIATAWCSAPSATTSSALRLRCATRKRISR